MKKITAAFAAVLLFSSITARAGVVLEEEEAVQTGAPGRPAATHKRTVMVEGHKEKVVSDNRTTVIDLDKGTMTVINAADKSYFESVFPPAGPGRGMIKQFLAQNLNYEKSGAEKTIAGYKCQQYSSSAKTPNGEFSITACYSKDAPGASDYAAFQKAAALKLKGDSSEAAGNTPEGVPLATHTTRKIISFTMPGLPPEQARKLNELMAKRPPVVSDATVTRISSQSLPADTFAIPTGYTRHEMRRPMMGPGAGGPMVMPGAPMMHPPSAASTP